MMNPIDKMSTTDKVIESIRNYIREPSRKLGEKLPTENALSSQLGVGRSSVREALRVLQTMGYIDIIHGKGAFIKSSTPSSEPAERWFEENYISLSDIYVVRETVEPLAVRLAAQNISDAGVDELRKIVEETERITALPIEDINSNQLAQLDELFHERIWEYTNNLLLMSMYKQLVQTLRTYRMNSFSILKNRYNMVQPHRRIMESLANHDAAAADREMRLHMKISKDDMLEAAKKDTLSDRIETVE